jgi:hypothetical protein
MYAKMGKSMYAKYTYGCTTDPRLACCFGPLAYTRIWL